MDEKEFAERLASLRMRKNVSAREMSLAIGQNESYINRIENKVCYPSMQCFFYICEYLDISPSDFFDTGKVDPTKLQKVYESITQLNEEQLDIVNSVVNGLLGKKNIPAG